MTSFWRGLRWRSGSEGGGVECERKAPKRDTLHPLNHALKSSKPLIHSATLPHCSLRYHEAMRKKKKVTRNVRISLQAWEQIRRIAYRAHKPMSVIVERLVTAKR